ncbi:MAG: N-acetylglucosamine-6-phosphate deacetylase [Synergistaceae bacterium]|jgi:N-acetylglucosamine-6-phosphate deacetylase|nr:N-acetylglucosamine-6-phosphate deacetylase [Synergistaceae bacterium]
MIVRGARVFGEPGFEAGDIFIDGELISDKDCGGGIIDASGLLAVPGLIDIHLHGCVGSEFAAASDDGLKAMARYEAANGVTAVCPATPTLPEDALAESCRRISRFGTPGGAAFAGIYLEGPFISPEKSGALNPAYAQKPDAALFRRLQSASGGMVKVLAVAPELEGAISVISEIRDDVVCSVAHTAADYETARLAFAAGARQVTHLFNAMPGFHHREPGVIGAASDAPECQAELICDGTHVHPSAVRAAFRLFGGDRVLMVSDSMMATGLGDGEYEIGGLPVSVRGGRATLAQGGALAGSTTNLTGCLRAAVRDMGIPIHTAVKCATVNPAKAIGVFSERGSLDAGKLADIVLLDGGLNVKQVILRGTPLM